jgi:hypothetical protein
VICWYLEAEWIKRAAAFHDRLQPTNEMLWNASQCRVAVIQPREGRVTRQATGRQSPALTGANFSAVAEPRNRPTQSS